MPLTALTELETVEVSLVPKGANLKKRFPIMKRDEENSMSDILHAVIDAQTSEDSHFENVIKSAELSEEAGQAIKGAMKILSAYADQVPAEQALDVVSSGLGISKSSVSKEDEEDKDKEVKELAVMISEAEKEDEDEKESASKEDEEDKESAEKEHEPGHDKESAEKEHEPGHDKDDEKESASKEDEDEDDAKKMYVYEEKEDDEDDEDDKKSSLQKSMKKLAPAVRDQVTALWKSQKEAVAKAEKLERSLAVERDERLRKEFVAKAHKEFRFVPGKSPDETGLMLKSLHAMDSQIAKDIEGIFKSVSAMIEKGSLLDEIGSSMTSYGDSSSAFAKLDTIAKSQVEKSGKSYAQSFDEAMTANPDLYTAYLNEQAK
tara:strand:- start:7258 stop:8385 length:1128 start_codon:yes stop_codon:yes gene_type:complete